MKPKLVFVLILALLVACSGDKDENDGGSASVQSTPRPPAKPYTAWTVAEVQPLPEALAEFNLIGRAWLSPDSSKIAWQDEKNTAGENVRRPTLCLFARAEADLNCTPLPDNYRSDLNWLVWSGDSQRLFFTESALIFLDESDVWEMEIASGTITDRTDDQSLNNPLRREAGDPPALMDYDTNWNAARNELYFLRSVYSDDEERRITLELFRLANGDTAEQVRDLTDDLPRLSIMADMAFSPDGGRVALVVNPVGAPDSEGGGLWLLDLDSGDLKHTATMSALHGTPASEFQDGVLIGFMPYDAAWADDDGVVVYLYNQIYEHLFSVLVVYVNVETGAVTRLIDISDLTERDMLQEPDDAGHLPRHYWPRRGLVSPDGGTFFYLHMERPGEDIHISALPLPPDGSPPVLLSTQPGDSYITWFGPDRADRYLRERLLTVNADGWALIGQNLVHFVAE